MEYILTEKGLVFSIIIPIVLQCMIIIDIEKEMAQKKKKIVTIVWYLFGGGTGYLLYLYQFGTYLCYIWILTFVIGYPVLYGFAKVGDLLNKNFSTEEQKIYNKLIYIFMNVSGIVVISFVYLGEFLGFVVNKSELQIVILSKILYSALGMSCIFRGILLKER